MSASDDLLDILCEAVETNDACRLKKDLHDELDAITISCVLNDAIEASAWACVKVLLAHKQGKVAGNHLGLAFETNKDLKCFDELLAHPSVTSQLLIEVLVEIIPFCEDDMKKATFAAQKVLDHPLSGVLFTNQAYDEKLGDLVMHAEAHLVPILVNDSRFDPTSNHFQTLCETIQFNSDDKAWKPCVTAAMARGIKKREVTWADDDNPTRKRTHM